MQPKEIGEKYDKVAEWWNNELQNSNYGLKQIQRAIKYSKKKSHVLDVGCGSGGRIIRELQKHKFQIHGIDVSNNMLALFSQNHPDISIECADILNWKTEKKFDLIIAWDSIFHLTMENQFIAIKKLCGFLQKEGVLIYTFGDAVGNKEDYSFSDENGKQKGNLSNDKFGYGSIGINGNLKEIIKNNCKCLHLELDQYPLEHVYVIARKE